MAPRPCSPWRKHFEAIAARARGGLRRASQNADEDSKLQQVPSPLSGDSSETEEEEEDVPEDSPSCKGKDKFPPHTPALSEYSDSFETDDLSVGDSLSEVGDDEPLASPAAPPPTLEEFTTLRREDFDISCVIGKGSYSSVYKAMHIPTGVECALKAVSKRRTFAKTSNLTHLKGEKEIVELMDGSPFVVQTAGTFQTATSVYFVMEYLPDGDLYKKANSGDMSIGEIHVFLAHALLGIEAVHSKGAIHRDIKPENFLVDRDGSLKLTDFGFAKMAPTQGERLTSQYGTPEYVAPEVLRGTGYGQPVDMWALGILCYELIVGRSPFQDENLEIMYANILGGQVRFPPNAKGMTGHAKSLIRGLLRQNPARRMNVDEVKSHPFFDGIDFEALYESAHKPSVLPRFQPSSVEDELDDGYNGAFAGF